MTKNMMIIISFPQAKYHSRFGLMRDGQRISHSTITCVVSTDSWGFKLIDWQKMKQMNMIIED